MRKMDPKIWEFYTNYKTVIELNGNCESKALNASKELLYLLKGKFNEYSFYSVPYS